MKSPEEPLFLRQISEILKDTEGVSEKPILLDPSKYRPGLDEKLLKWRERFMISGGVIGAAAANVFFYWGSSYFHRLDNWFMVGVASTGGYLGGLLVAEGLAQVVARISTKEQ